MRTLFDNQEDKIMSTKKSKIVGENYVEILSYQVD